nr:hypothetical protein [Halosimplex litoreum]
MVATRARSPPGHRVSTPPGLDDRHVAVFVRHEEVHVSRLRDRFEVFDRPSDGLAGVEHRPDGQGPHHARLVLAGRDAGEADGESRLVDPVQPAGEPVSAADARQFVGRLRPVQLRVAPERGVEVVIAGEQRAPRPGVLAGDADERTARVGVGRERHGPDPLALDVCFVGDGVEFVQDSGRVLGDERFTLPNVRPDRGRRVQRLRSHVRQRPVGVVHLARELHTETRGLPRQQKFVHADIFIRADITAGDVESGAMAVPARPWCRVVAAAM